MPTGGALTTPAIAAPGDGTASTTVASVVTTAQNTVTGIEVILDNVVGGL
ncbi:hypothetical protein ACFQ6V_17395 [Streptomyces roseifaciens]